MIILPLYTLTLKLKDYIKKAKAWRNQVWHSKCGKNPSSYLLSVLVVKAYENSGYLKGPQESVFVEQYYYANH